MNELVAVVLFVSLLLLAVFVEPYVADCEYCGTKPNSHEHYCRGCGADVPPNPTNTCCSM